MRSQSYCWSISRCCAPGKVVVSSGNHDLTGPDAQGEQTALWLAEARAGGLPTDGDSLLLDDTLVTICPWWDGPLGREAVATQLAADATRRPARWIWVYHWPPLGSPTCWTGRRHYGDADVGAWIAEHQPDFVLTGHVHQPPFKPDGAWADHIGSTWVFNPGNQVGPVPTHIEFDLAAGHWKELPIALYPDEHGTMFSGSAIVDWGNTAGFQTGREKSLVCMFTAAGKAFTQGLAHSNDRGRTWTKYRGNPVSPHVVAENRDPKVVWHAATKKWIMALYLTGNDVSGNVQTPAGSS